MGRPILSICTRCEPARKSRDDATKAWPGTGEELYESVRALRKARGFKELFKVEEVHCLSLCDTPCAIQLEGKKRSTLTRVHVAVRDAAALVEAAAAYAGLSPGQELPERLLPGEHAD